MVSNYLLVIIKQFIQVILLFLQLYFNLHSAYCLPIVD